MLFAPAPPARLRLWPHVAGVRQYVTQVAVCLYLLLGAVGIDRRRRSRDQLGVNGRGLALSLVGGGLLILAVDRPLWTQPATAPGLLGAVGVTEALLFRGVIYGALDERRGARWAIGGSSLAFGLHQLPSQGLLSARGSGSATRSSPSSAGGLAGSRA